MKNAQREPQTTMRKHNTHKNKKKPNMHKQQQPHRPPRHKCKYVTCRATLRYKSEKSTTITRPTKVTKRCSRENLPSPARLLTEGAKGMPPVFARICRRKQSKI